MAANRSIVIDADARDLATLFPIVPLNNFAPELGRSNAQNHHFRRLNQRRHSFAFAQTQFPRGFRGNDGGDALTSNGKLDLRQQSFRPYLDNVAQQLVAPADAAEVFPGHRWFSRRHSGKVSFHLTHRYAVMAARRLHRFQLLVINPLLQRLIADANGQRRFARRHHFRVLAHNPFCPGRF